ncbi:MAG: gamma-glutamyl-gamma-aminobutyrate hydrolase family protein [Psychromonas sp.]
MPISESKPVIAIISCSKTVLDYQVQSVNEFYINAITAFGGIPLIIPSVSTPADLAILSNCIDGLLLPGSHSNVDPIEYGATHTEDKKDKARDSSAFHLIDLCVEQQIPVLGICRGFQEMNVAMGGSLTPKVHEAGFSDHREITDATFDLKYASAHPVHVAESGVFANWLTTENNLDQNSINLKTIDVNTLHNQGVNQIAASLTIEAKAPDGLIEAFSLADHPYFIGVQWHPEWQATTNPFSQLLFSKLISAAHIRRKTSHG